MERCLISCQVRTNYAAQPLNGTGQVSRVHLLQLDCNRDVEQFVFAVSGLVFPMCEQTGTEDPSKAHERPTIADRAFVTPAIADHLAIKAKDGIPEWKATWVQLFPCLGKHIHPTFMGE